MSFLDAAYSLQGSMQLRSIFGKLWEICDQVKTKIFVIRSAKRQAILWAMFSWVFIQQNGILIDSLNPNFVKMAKAFFPNTNGQVYLTDKPTGINFIHTLLPHFFTKVFWAAFLCFEFGFVRTFVQKSACKILMKLTLVVIKNVRNVEFYLSFLTHSSTLLMKHEASRFVKKW